MRLCISSEVQILQVDHQGFVARFPIIGMEHLTNPIDVFSQAKEYLHIILRVHDANDDMKFVVENKESFALHDLHESTLLMELPQDFPSGSYRLRFELFDTITSPFVGDSILSMHEVYWQKPPLQSSGSGRTQFIVPWKMTYASSNPKAAMDFCVQYLGAKSYQNDLGTPGCSNIHWVYFEGTTMSPKLRKGRR